VDSADILGRREDLSGKVVASWDIFRGGQDMWRRQEMADRMIEQTQRLARLQRSAFESLDKAWAARTLTSDRLASLQRQSDAARKVIEAYTKEYELGQRTLFDLLNVQNNYFNTLVSIVSTRSVAVFADYQLLAAMGHLLEYIKTAPPPEADPMAQRPFGLFPYRLPPVILRDPDVAPEPLNVNGAVAPTPYLWGPKVIMFGERAPGWAVAESPASRITEASASRSRPAESTVESRWPEAVSAFTSQDAERMAGPFAGLTGRN
jgi:adhesin transport system outer membrane protein